MFSFQVPLGKQMVESGSAWSMASWMELPGLTDVVQGDPEPDATPGSAVAPGVMPTAGGFCPGISSVLASGVTPSVGGFG
jgi:hypothetical protein